MLIYGFHPLREALRHRPHEVERVWVAARSGGRRQEVESLCRRHRIPLSHDATEVLARLAESAPEAVHNGFIAELRPAPSAAAGDPELLVLVEDVQDPRNLGALLRVCEAAGVGRVLIRDRGSAPLSATVVKTSAGAAEHLAVERIVNPARTLEQLKADGFWVYGLAAGGEAPWEADLTGKVVLCVGGEEKGLRALTRRKCDRLLGLPMRGHVGSLNLATAAAAALYEALRQRSGG
jgi:23S rRNA (guanosine2251-2'-O)-methyltransferase